MLRFAILFASILLVVPVQNFRIKRQTHRYSAPRTAQAQTTRDGVPIIAESYSRTRAASSATRHNQPTDQGLSLYDDFVNDPWKPTQERGTSMIPQRERSGGQTHDPRDNVWNSRHPTYWSTSQRPTPTTTERSNRPIGSATGSDWDVSSRAGDHVTYVRRKSNYQSPTSREEVERMRETERTRELDRLRNANSRNWDDYYRQYPNYYPYGDGSEWIVHSQSDDHVTYKKRGTGVSSYWDPVTSPPVKRLGQGPGEVLARVVKTDEEPEGIQSGQSDWRPKIQLKSGDSVSYRRDDGSEHVFPRYRDGDRRRVIVNPPTISTVRPERYEQEGNWRVVSKDDSHITWTRIGSDYEHRATRPHWYHRSTTTPVPYWYSTTTPAPYWYSTTTPVPYWYSTTTPAPYWYSTTTPAPTTTPQPLSWARGGGPHYPMLHEKEMADRANRLGASNTLAVVY